MSSMNTQYGLSGDFAFNTFEKFKMNYKINTCFVSSMHKSTLLHIKNLRGKTNPNNIVISKLYNISKLNTFLWKLFLKCLNSNNKNPKNKIKYKSKLKPINH